MVNVPFPIVTSPQDMPLFYSQIKRISIMAEFVVRCPQCNTKLQVQDEWGGMEVECAKCKNVFAIPKQDSNTPASPVYTCTQCKKEYSEMTKFCSECGGKV